MPSRGSKRGRNRYVTRAFSGVPTAKRGEKIRIGHLTRACSGAQKTAELPQNPAFSGVPYAKRADKIRSGHLTHAFSGGPKEGGIAT